MVLARRQQQQWRYIIPDTTSTKMTLGKTLFCLKTKQKHVEVLEIIIIIRIQDIISQVFTVEVNES